VRYHAAYEPQYNLIYELAASGNTFEVKTSLSK